MISIRRFFFTAIIIIIIVMMADIFDVLLLSIALIIGLLPVVLFSVLSDSGREYFDAFSPIWVFPAVYGLVYGFGAIRYINELDVLSFDLLVNPLVGVFFYFIFMLMAVVIYNRSASDVRYRSFSMSSVNFLTIVVILISSLAAAFMVSKVGLPFLYEDKLDARLGARAIVSSNVIYLIRISFVAFYIYIASVFHYKKELSLREIQIITILFIYICFINLIPGWRGPIFIFIFNSLMVYHYKYRHLNLKKSFIYGFLFMTLILIWGFTRVYYHPDELLIISVLRETSDLPIVIFLMWTTYQFSVYTLGFKTVLDLFQGGDYLYGGVFGLTVATLAPGKQETLGEVIKDQAGFEFAGAGLNPTILGDAYADGGLGGVIIYMSIIGWVMGYCYSVLKKNPSVFNVVLYAYITTCVVLGTLTGLLSQASYTFHFFVLLGCFGFLVVLNKQRRSF